mgnify:CR=1 FL=1
MNNLSDSYNEEFIEINTPKGLVYMNYDISEYQDKS